MISYEIESIYLVSQLVYYGRLYVQYSESKKRKLSVNPKLFWKLTIIASALMGIYGYLIGSVLMPITNAITIIYSITQHKIGA